MLKNEKLLILVFVLLLILDIVLISVRRNYQNPVPPERKTWAMESIDSVKYSRDTAREFGTNSGFDAKINLQVKAIAETGANYIAIGTPYDAEFVPYMQKWVNAARENNLKVWFRGNFSGWEKWFEYKKIDRDEHQKLLKQFILDNGNLFEDGDIFSSCTECENGGSGDPRQNGDVEGHRKFLIEEYQISRNAFSQIGKNVSTNYFPMNYDVAKLTMDKETTKALGGIVVIDHYVSTPEKLIDTIKQLEESSGGKIVLGEFGAPIPDIHGDMTEEEQADWINRSLMVLAEDENVIGVNYWTGFGGSTRIWKSDGTATVAVDVIKNYYNPAVFAGIVQNEAGQSIAGATVKSVIRNSQTTDNGEFVLAYPEGKNSVKITIDAAGYKTKTQDINPQSKYLTITLKKQNENLFFNIQKFLFKYLGI